MGYTSDSEVPFASGSDTSRDAAESMDTTASTYRARVLAFVEAKGAHGATADEVQMQLGLTHQNGSARVSELASKHGKLFDSGQRRPTRSGRKAVVYVTARHRPRPLEPSGQATLDL